MLYVFHVDAGKMLTFDMCTAVESVQNLKEQIEQQQRIPVACQVLLVSGGEMLDLSNRVCSYSAGTDTNPIFMFSTLLDANNPPQPWPSIEYNAEDMRERVEICLSLPANYQTVMRRNQVAQQFDELARNEVVICEKMVHEQHLQQQGWAAVVANLEDLTAEFKERCQYFDRIFAEMCEKREHHLQCLSTFNEDLEKLASIPILPALTQNAEKPFHAFDDLYDDGNDSMTKQTKSNESSTSAKSTDSGKAKEPKAGTSNTIQEEAVVAGCSRDEETKPNDSKAITLLEWIARNENQISLRKMAEQCLNGFNKFSGAEIVNLRADAQKAIDAADKEDVKAIKGLEDRLSGLEILMQEAKLYLKEQTELAQGFQQNQNRVNNLGDASILPDLCASHGKQLTVMFTNHKKLRSIRSRVSKAKAELRANLLQRLRFVIILENKMHDLNVKLLFNKLNCVRLHKHMCIIEQIHQAPTVYVTAVTEVVRRRNFSNAFLTWASDLASHLVNIYNDECTKRTKFKTLFDGHFLTTLFPGMEDMPPAFAIEAPSTFDASLPNLTKADLAELSVKIPDVASKFELPDLSTVIEFFQSRSGSQKSQEQQSGSNEQSETERDKKQDSSTQSNNANNVIGASGDTVAVTNRLLDIYSHLKEYERGFESETDTEEYEKVGQSPVERRRTSDGGGQASKTLTSSTQTSACRKPDTSTVGTSTDEVQMVNTETLTEENLATTTLEVERLKKLLKEISTLSRDSIGVLKKELSEVKSDCSANKAIVGDNFTTINKAWTQIQDETAAQSQQLIKQTMDHELEMNDLKKREKSNMLQIHVLKCDKESVESEKVLMGKEHAREKEKLQEKLDEMAKQMTDLQSKLDVMVNDKEKTIKDVTDKLNKEYNYKVEVLRSRHRLLSSMERSPSDTSLEKIERNDLMDMSGAESFLTQSQISGAVAIRGRERDTKYLELSSSPSTLVSSSPKSPSSTSRDFFKRVLDEKEKQMDSFRSHIDQLIKDNDRYKQTIIDLTDNKTRESDLNNKLLALERELEEERQKRTQIEQSVANLSKTETIETEGISSTATDQSVQGHIDQLIKDNDRYKQTIMDLTEHKNRENDLSSKLQAVEKELEEERQKRKMEQSFATLPKMDASQVSSVSTNVSDKHVENLRKDMMISVSSCSVGSNVLVVWDYRYNNYVIFQECPTPPYFLHSEPSKVSQLGNTPSLGFSYFIGRVEHKEYCIVRKEENRYNLDKGTKFYRVKVQPKAPGKSSKGHLSRSTSSNKCDMSTSTTTVTAVPVVPPSSSTVTEMASSFAQTEAETEVVSLPRQNEDLAGKDMIDSGLDTTSTCRSLYKERTTSGTDDEATVVGEEAADYKPRYLSVSEEDENVVDSNQEERSSTGSIGIFTLIESFLSPM